MSVTPATSTPEASDPPPSDTEQREHDLTAPHEPLTTSVAAATWALFTGIGLMMVGNGLQGTLLGVRSEAEGFTTAATGAVMACYFAGFLFGSRMATKALGNVGHIRVFSALASIASASVLVHAIAVHPLTWGLMRFATGVCFAGLYVVAESWLNDLATNKTRGRLMAVYMVVTMAGAAGGQLLLNVASPEGFELFVVASVLVSLSLVPVSLSASSTPPVREIIPFPLAEVWKIVPTGVVTSFLGGMAAGALMGMGAVYASKAGLSAGQIGTFMFAPMAGAIALQFPIGMISDRVPRRGVIFVVAVAATMVSLSLTLVEADSFGALVLMFLLGGTMFPLYSLGIAYTNDWLPQDKIMGASSSLVFSNGVGAVIGPMLGAGLIFGFGNSAFFWSTTLTHGALAIYAGYRIIATDPIAVEDQGDFVPFPARAGAGAAGLLVKRVPKPKLKPKRRPGERPPRGRQEPPPGNS